MKHRSARDSDLQEHRLGANICFLCTRLFRRCRFTHRCRFFLDYLERLVNALKRFIDTIQVRLKSIPTLL